MLPEDCLETDAPRTIPVEGPLPLGSFLKLSGAVATGGEAKRLIQGGAVRVNGQIELRRGHKVAPGDDVEIAGATYVAQHDAPAL